MKIISTWLLIFTISLPVYGQKPIRISFTLNKCNLPIVTAQWNGNTGQFVIDTGSSHTVFADKHNKTVKADKKTILLLSENYQIAVSAKFIDMSYANKQCGQIDGVIGNDFLGAAHLTTFDYVHKILLLIYKTDHN